MPTYDDQQSPGSSSESWVTSAARMATAGMSTESMDKMASEAGKMIDSARSGGFMVSEDAAQPIRKTLLEMRNRVEQLHRDFTVISLRQPPLGDHDYGRMVAAHQQKAAAGVPGSATDMLDKLRQVLIDADKALEIAVEKYKESDESALNSFRGQA